MTTPAEVLHYLAGLTPGRRNPVTSSFEAVASPRDFVWLGEHAIHDSPHGQPPPLQYWDRYSRSLPDTIADAAAGGLERLADEFRMWQEPPTTVHYTLPTKIRSDSLERLVRLDALNPGRDAIRLGSTWIVGQHRVDKQPEPILFPVLVRQARIHEISGLNLFQPQWLSDVEPHPIFDEVITDDERELLRTRPPSTHLVTELCARLGLPRPTPLETGQSPLTMASKVERLGRHDDVVLYVASGTATFLIAPEKPTTIAAGLHRWSAERLDDTAFAALYSAEPLRDEADDVTGEGIASPLPTNDRQRQAIERARAADISVVSGPPGTGKTHLVVATAIDAIAQGEAVLIATKSDHAAESVCEVLGRQPSPAYVRFGRAEHRQRVAEQLAASRHASANDVQMRRAEDAEAGSRARYEEQAAIIRSLLEREADFEEGLRNRSAMAMLTADVPKVRDPAFDLAEAQRLIEQVTNPSGLLGRWRARRGAKQLRSLVAAEPGTELDTIARAVRFAHADRQVADALDSGGTALAEFWADLDAAESQWRADLANLIDVRRRHTGRIRRRRARTSVAALANVLRSGMTRRSELLSTIESDDFLDMLPLWIGTLDEIERTLPVVPGLFDLVILDEASQIDQILAAGALCRAGRAMVVGDPKQLRHVSFVSDDRMDGGAVRLADASPELKRLLDVRRNSLYDIATAAAPVTWLDEHFRSLPHIIEFSASRFYDDSLRLMTQHPRAEGHDAIDVTELAGERVDGVNQVEVDHVRDLVADLMYRPGVGTIGVVSPFRKQADALIESLRDRFSANQMRWSGLRAGTVHEFQGIERDTVIISLALGPDDLTRSLRFIEDPNLFNVMITRARRRVIVICSFPPDALPAGTMADYLRASHVPPDGIPPSAPTSEWARTVAQSLTDGGRRVVTGYPVAGWTIDVALGTGDEALGVECGVHPAGVDRHIERHLALRRAGWDLVDAFQSRWALSPEELAVWLTVEMNDRENAAASDAAD